MLSSVDMRERATACN